MAELPESQAIQPSPSPFLQTVKSQHEVEEKRSLWIEYEMEVLRRKHCISATDIKAREEARERLERLEEARERPR